MTLKHVLKYFSKKSEDLLFPRPLREREELLSEQSELSNSGEGYKELPSPVAFATQSPKCRKTRHFDKMLKQVQHDNFSCAKHTVKDLSSNRLSVLTTLKKCAFTLAEVLITLGIIGVVAALTLPTLISNYKNQVYVNKLKKMVSLLENGVRQAAADEGTDVKNTKFYQILNVYECIGWNVCNDKVDAIRKYFKVLQADDTSYSTQYTKNKIHGGTITVYGNIALADGTSLYNQGFGYSTFYLDINGDNKPNTYGRDFFAVIVDAGGLMHDAEDCVVEGNYGYVAYYAGATSCGLCKDKLASDPNYDGCYLYRIQSNGWKMDY